MQFWDTPAPEPVLLYVKKRSTRFYRFVKQQGDMVILDRDGAYFMLSLDDFNNRYELYQPSDEYCIV